MAQNSATRFFANDQIYFPATTLNGDVMFQFAELALGKNLQVIDARCYIRRIHQNRTMDAPVEIHLQKAVKSIPIAIQYLHKIMSKIQIPEKFRIEIEREAIIRYFSIYISRLHIEENCRLKRSIQF